MQEIAIKEINPECAEYGRLLQFRNEVLRKPLGLDLFSEDLSMDSTNIILVVVQGEEVVGCVMLQPIDQKTVQLRQMGISDRLQGKGIGRVLAEDAEEAARERGYTRIILHARLTAKGFYEKLGYQSFGKEFIEVTIPHTAMQKEL